MDTVRSERKLILQEVEALMKDLLKKLKKRLADEEAIRYLKFMAIPLVVVVLVFVVVVADGSDKVKEAEPSDVTQGETKDRKDTDENGKEITLKREKTGDEIYNLMEAYFKARKTCDAGGFSQVYGNTASPQDVAEESGRMEEEVKYCQDYLNLVCYSVKGLGEGSLVVYSRFDIKFRQSDTPAPSMFACYAKRGADESWHLEAKPSADEAAYMEEVNRSDAVKDMVAQVNSDLSAALEKDSGLLSVYHALTDETPAPGVSDTPGVSGTPDVSGTSGALGDPGDGAVGRE